MNHIVSFLKEKRILKIMRSAFFSSFYFAVLLIYLECVFHLTEFRNLSAFFPVLFAVPAGILIGFFCDLFPEKAARILRYVFSVLIMLAFGTQIVYYHSFQSFMSVSQIGMGGAVFTNFLKIILVAIWETLIPILLIFLPLVFLVWLQKKWDPRNEFNWKKSLTSVGCFLLTEIIAVFLLPLAGTGEHSAYSNFHKNWVLDLSMEKLGMVTTSGIDIRKTLSISDKTSAYTPDVPIFVTVPVESESAADQPSTETTDGSEPLNPEDPVSSPYHIIEGLDFLAMAETETNETVKLVEQYLAALSPTKKNAYTGKFQGYNLIMICAESFSPVGIDKELTPTLYKLAHSGFDFTNYWTLFPSNTTNGEYSYLTGLIPDLSKPKSDGSFVASVQNTMNMNIARFFSAGGLVCRAYHDHSGSYYKRNETHPHLGYLFHGKEDIGGLSGWPESDLTMMQRTIPDYIGDETFHVYYMTVSGHHNYKFGGFNSIADKNKTLVDKLEMGESAKAYLACHIELDRALAYLIDELEKAGKLDKTVICLSTDHYPYGLTDKEYRDMLGHSLKYDGLERYASDLIIWNSAMETVTVDKPCCPVDVLPTLLNLFGFEYDSRLYSGTDILSDSAGLAMISNQSFITDKIIYNSRYEKVYKLDSSWTMPDGYLDAYIQIVKNRFSIAANILEYDFYARIPAELISAAQRKTWENVSS